MRDEKQSGRITGQRESATVVLAEFLEVMLQSLDQGNAPPFELSHDLWQLYRLTRKLSEPEQYHELFTSMVKKLPAKIRRDILRGVRTLDDPAAVMLTDVLKAHRRLRAV